MLSLGSTVVKFCQAGKTTVFNYFWGELQPSLMHTHSFVRFPPGQVLVVGPLEVSRVDLRQDLMFLRLGDVSTRWQGHY